MVDIHPTKVAPYYTEDLGVPNSRFIKLIHALNSEASGPGRGISVSLLDGTGRVSPVFLIENKDGFQDGVVYPHEHGKFCFIFDSEWDKLYTTTSVKGRLAFIKSNKYDSVREHITNNRFMLFFKGSDDCSVGLRFGTEKEALDFIDMLDVFEDIFSGFDILRHN